ncbi:MAG: 30S ribosomal protein S2 [Candidatus Uhrbacteria bacterium GW2011_GWF2_41_16]|uniref:Small ribosomal subunit protein uS2 n=2 Tax=Candidatus Uhriibacteriota TaxID=1752732 RepID=A0A0G0VC83_9BACT|nr:MAG: 30S ribosomal protein S2 [Candidatus Uhrbacteria bacterium GW2011_GWA2_41_10]KKR87573.1 MAG: 30S ribosomal protein S2 [Candidatus Uhrbacteria bacterium GW2011_GWC2_41_11]KKR98553.1 MAG: 30S ribosomal protein S2 [Candidatus Uhrbacteria bacterium GW2011_GWF2_41_16]HBO99910.1 30S ribosomal protein S2 [Candidatus Uhrbacteria bacterium]
MPTIPKLEDMLKAGIHFGHQSSRWHPRMEPYIFTERGGIHIINLEKTQEMLSKALDILKGIASRGGVIMCVGTKRQAQEILKTEMEACGMPYVNQRWLGGTLTNFAEIRKLIRRYKMLKDQQAKGELKKYTKKEQLMFAREIEELDKKVGGIQTIDRLPDALFIVDIKTEKTALEEAIVTGIPVIALCDTNVNPDDVQYPIPANDDAVKSIQMMLHLVSEAIQEGKNQKQKEEGAV